MPALGISIKSGSCDPCCSGVRIESGSGSGATDTVAIGVDWGFEPALVFELAAGELNGALSLPDPSEEGDAILAVSATRDAIVREALPLPLLLLLLLLPGDRAVSAVVSVSVDVDVDVDVGPGAV